MSRDTGVPFELLTELPAEWRDELVKQNNKKIKRREDIKRAEAAAAKARRTN